MTEKVQDRTKITMMD